MHGAVLQWVLMHKPWDAKRVLECGALNINGSARTLFPNGTEYTGVDPQAGPGVDVVADFRDYRHPEPVDLVLCLEVLEHTPTWRDLIPAMYRNLRPGGTAIITCATHGRPPHSGRSEAPIGIDEFYENVDPGALFKALEAAGFCEIQTDVAGTDLRAVAIRGNE